MNLWIIPAVAAVFGTYSYKKAKRNRFLQAIGFAFMPGLWAGATAWCLLTDQFGLVFIVIALICISLAYLYFSKNEFMIMRE